MTTAAFDERRQNQRFPLDLPLTVNWRDDNGEKRAETKVNNISSSGIYFRLPRKVDEKSKLEFYVRLRGRDVSGPGVLLHCLGSIVRMDPVGPAEGKADLGVAVHIDSYRFLRPDDKMPGNSPPAA